MITKSKSTFFVVIAIAVLVVAVIVYFFALRTPDTGYISAAAKLDEIISARSDIGSKINGINLSVDIDDSVVNDLEESASKYNDTLTSFSKESAVVRDSKVKEAYALRKNNLAEYGQSVSSLVSSLKQYQFILSTCSELVKKIDTFTSVASFDASAAECKETITTAKSAPYKLFNDQFLTEYTSRSDDLVEAYRNQVEVKISTKAKSVNQDNVFLGLVSDEVDKLGQTKLNLSPNSNPTNDLTHLKETLSSQKSAIIR